MRRRRGAEVEAEAEEEEVEEAEEKEGAEVEVDAKVEAEKEADEKVEVVEVEVGVGLKAHQKHHGHVSTKGRPPVYLAGGAQCTVATLSGRRRLLLGPTGHLRAKLRAAARMEARRGGATPHPAGCRPRPPSLTTSLLPKDTPCREALLDETKNKPRARRPPNLPIFPRGCRSRSTWGQDSPRRRGRDGMPGRQGHSTGGHLLWDGSLFDQTRPDPCRPQPAIPSARHPPGTSETARGAASAPTGASGAGAASMSESKRGCVPAHVAEHSAA